VGLRPRRRVDLDRQHDQAGHQEAETVQREREAGSGNGEQRGCDERPERDPEPAAGVVDGGGHLAIGFGEDRQRRAHRRTLQPVAEAREQGERKDRNRGVHQRQATPGGGLNHVGRDDQNPPRMAVCQGAKPGAERDRRQEVRQQHS